MIVKIWYLCYNIEDMHLEHLLHFSDDPTESELDDAAELLGSYDDARRAAGIHHDEKESDEISPSLDSDQETEQSPDSRTAAIGEKVIALQGVMEYFNLYNRHRGLALRIERDRRHGHDVTSLLLELQGMKKNIDRLNPQYEEYIATLAEADRLRADGQEEADVDLAIISTRSRLYRNYGPGNAYAKDRRRVIKQATSMLPKD